MNSPVPPTLSASVIAWRRSGKRNHIRKHSWRGHDMFVQLAWQQRIITLTQQSIRSWLKEDVSSYAEHNAWDRYRSDSLSRLVLSYPRCPSWSPFHVCFVLSLFVFCSFIPFATFCWICVYNNAAAFVLKLLLCGTHSLCG